MSTFTVENRTRTYEPRQDIYLRRGPFDDQFDCQLPEEARTELLEEIPPPQTYRLREIPTYRPAQEVFLRPPPPVSPLRPPVMPGAAKRPAQNAPREGGIWLGVVMLGLPITLALLVHAVATPDRTPLVQAPAVQVPANQDRPQIALRALPVHPNRNEAVNVTGLPYRSVWHVPPYGDLALNVKGELSSTAQLPASGEIGDAYAIGNHLWVYARPSWSRLTTWCDP